MKRGKNSRSPSKKPECATSHSVWLPDCPQLGERKSRCLADVSPYDER